MAAPTMVPRFEVGEEVAVAKGCETESARIPVTEAVAVAVTVMVTGATDPVDELLRAASSRSIWSIPVLKAIPVVP
jgi:hypothetical protein